MNIRDPIFSDIYVDDIARNILEDPHMQRLRYVKQLAFAYLVYPGANHTRFEHSLGTYHVASTIMRNIGDGVDSEVPYVGLLHDIGHAAFSHLSHFALEHYLGKTHEIVGEEIIKSSEIKDIISDSTLSFKRFLSYFRGFGKGQIVTGALGSDRIDYLSRDSYYTGVAYGALDANRLIGKITLSRGAPALYRQGVSGAESLLIARYLMFSSVYYHHTVVIAGAMYGKALSAAIEAGAIVPRMLPFYNDGQVISMLSAEKASAGLTERIMNRRLFKRVYDGPISKEFQTAELVDALGAAGLKSSDYIAEKLDFRIRDYELPIVGAGGGPIGRLTGISPLIANLAKAMNATRRLVVACDSSNLAKARPVVSRFLKSGQG
jgi:HD superfamily phosphohydrolase